MTSLMATARLPRYGTVLEVKVWQNLIQLFTLLAMGKYQNLRVELRLESSYPTFLRSFRMPQCMTLHTYNLTQIDVPVDLDIFRNQVKRLQTCR